MIDPETIEEVDDCDGESVHAYGFDPEAKAWKWDWLSLEYIAEGGRSDIIDRLFPQHDDEEDEPA